MALPLDLDTVVQTLGSPRVLGAIATAASLTLVLRSLYAFQPPKPLTIRPSIRNAPTSDALTKLKEVYPEDFYPSGGYFHGPYGATHYYVLGESGPKVVFVHGFSIPSVVWKQLAEKLASRGYQVLLYDLHGRGYSDAPDVPYTAALYTTQLALLMQYLKWDKAFIVGLSMGGAITTAFAADYPHLVDGKAVLIAPAGLMQPEALSRPIVLMSNLFFSPIFSHALRFIRTASAGQSRADEVQTLQRVALPGYLQALASSLRHGPLTGLEWAFTQVGSADTKVQFLHIHGTSDDVVPYSHTREAIAAFIPADHLQHLRLDGAGHDLCYDEKFAPIILEKLDTFLSN
ncbi:alpha/beta-hydrolase [Auriculariales sp. MPI-PUGE-AT-0066]|nr:alpha/beta-hydrolase [Auriculariales sp. MPI-PUGE-AT-0066]